MSRESAGPVPPGSAPLRPCRLARRWALSGPGALAPVGTLRATNPRRETSHLCGSVSPA